MINIDKEELEELQFGTIWGDDIAIISSSVETDGSTTLDIVFLGGQNKGQRARVDQDERFNDLTVDDDPPSDLMLTSLLKEGIFSLSKDDFTGTRVDGCEECESQEYGACIECLLDQLEEDKKKGDSR